jgi:hypothetical protein
MPGFVGKHRVSADATNFHTHFLEGGVVLSEVFELGWAHKGKVSWIKEEHHPFALKGRQAAFLESLFMKHLKVEIRDFLTDHREQIFFTASATTHIILHKRIFIFF